MHWPADAPVLHHPRRPTAPPLPIQTRDECLEQKAIDGQENPVNVIAGVGTAAEGSYEELAALLTESPRGRELVRLVRAGIVRAALGKRVRFTRVEFAPFGQRHT